MPFAVQSEPPLVEPPLVAPPMQTAVHSTGLQIAPDLAMHARQSPEAAAQKPGQPGASRQPAAETLAQMSLQEGADAPPVPPVVLPEPVVVPVPAPPAPPVVSLPPQPASAIIPVIPSAVIRPIACLNIEIFPPDQIRTLARTFALPLFEGVSRGPSNDLGLGSIPRRWPGQGSPILQDHLPRALVGMIRSGSRGE
jgi:hypothetical protein